MKTDIAQCVDMGFDGIVSGILKKDYTLDAERTETLVEASKDLKFTFHRAFDWVKDPKECLDRLEVMDVDYILTSGQQKSAEAGIALLTELHQQAKKIQVMPGGGIRPENVGIF